MINTELIKNQLFEKGYYVGKVDEIIKDSETFQKTIDKLIQLSDDKKSIYRYRHVIRMHPELGSVCEVDEIDTRKKLVIENNWTIGQQWYETMHTTDIMKLLIFFRNEINEFIPKLYPELNKDNIHHLDNFALYENGDLIENHRDGSYTSNEGRLCVILIYLTDEKDYNDGGGKFILNDNGIQIIPVKGTYTILDFSKNNVSHEVEEVKNNFRRFSYINFVYNNEKRI